MNATRPLSSRSDAVTAKLQAQRQAMNAASAATLAPADVANWLTLQSLTLTQPGVCTEPEMFYRSEGSVLVSESNGKVLLEPQSTIRFNTAFNLLGVEALSHACRLGRLAFGICGSGQVEVRVYQGLAGRSRERLVCDIVTLTTDTEVLFDLSQSAANINQGALWVELRACDADEGVRLDAGRFLTSTLPDANIRLAICRPAHPTSSDADRILPRLLDWAAGHGPRVGIFGQTTDPHCAAHPSLIITDPAESTAAYVVMLTAARARGFSHALLIDPDSAVAPETLDRCLAYLSILRDPHVALGASVLDVSESWLLADNGMVRNPDGKPVPLFAGADLRDVDSVLDAGFESVTDTASDLIRAESTFLALSLDALAADIAADLATERLGIRRLTVVRDHILSVNQMPGLVLRRDTFGSKVAELITLQHVIFPEQGICTESDLFYHSEGTVAYDERAGSLSVENDSVARFDTYFNALSIGKWHENTALDGLWLGITGRGKVEIKVFHAIPDRSWEQLATLTASLSKGNEVICDLSHYPDNATRGLIYFEMRALSTGVALTAARFMTRGAPDPTRKLALSITTYKREAQVENTARRLAHYFERSEFADYMDAFIVDNGDSAKIAPNPKIRRIPNANLGGAGGFTRGLLEADAAGYSHVLFMDDDASIPMEALHRTYAFLTLASNPKVAVAGAMINNTDKWRMWENGAVFDRKCKPLFGGTDLRQRDQVFQMEYESARSRSSKMYGGWWFFAFPVAQVARHPFPFFVRGDDVNFSLVNDFAITTLNGVVSFADDFIDKESPLTWYLDLRSHMVHHLTLDKMEVGRFQLARIGTSFFLRNLVKFQYETIAAVLMAWSDVLQGPDFFTDNPDAAAPRAAIKALTVTEAWQPIADIDTSLRTGFLGSFPKVRRLIYPWTLNGHFLPFFPLWGSKRVIPPSQRGHLDAIWGASQLTYLNSNRDQGYVTRRSNLKAAGLTIRLLALWLRTVLRYGRLRATYRRRYPEITTPGYWQQALALPSDGAPPPIPLPEAAAVRL